MSVLRKSSPLKRRGSRIAGKGVGKTSVAAEIKARGMAAFPLVGVSISSEPRLFYAYRFNGDSPLSDDGLKVANYFCPAARFDDDGYLDESGSRNARHGCC